MVISLVKKILQDLLIAFFLTGMLLSGAFMRHAQTREVPNPFAVLGEERAEVNSPRPPPERNWAKDAAIITAVTEPDVKEDRNFPLRQ